MKFKGIILLLLVGLSCNNANENKLNSTPSDRFELLPEPDKAEKELYFKNLNLNAFLKNPIDLPSLKNLKHSNDTTTSKSYALEYHFQPEIQDALCYTC
ncbi:hypothetical protein [Winogradskyella thalassocola]|uniref:Uncharacterized protein n=1 Tax=Winogradskyella thalassocola TaxID=262004 RepID=A0A1G8D3I9_9FLAO|nr:hypothetical protein [Winogradskyella thalassocola]SDH52377.1 hypothetical protein SAMN04489796_103115 [Winogradskyella thalassocola]